MVPERATTMVAWAKLLRAMVLQGATMVVRADLLGELLRVRRATTMVDWTKWLRAMVLE
jgi:hypothetical protein